MDTSKDCRHSISVIWVLENVIFGTPPLNNMSNFPPYYWNFNSTRTPKDCVCDIYTKTVDMLFEKHVFIYHNNYYTCNIQLYTRSGLIILATSTLMHLKMLISISLHNCVIVDSTQITHMLWCCQWSFRHLASRLAAHPGDISPVDLHHIL